MIAVFIITGMMAVISYAFNMRTMGWQSSSTTTLSVPVAGIFSARKQTVLLYASPETARYLESVGGNYDMLLKPWRNFFVQEKIAYKEITHLEESKDPSRMVLVLPSVLAIGNTERAAITDFRDRGGNILATSTLGARNGEGEWTGYEFARELLGVSVIGEISSNREERFLNLFGDLPFGQSFGAAERIWLGKLGVNPLRLKGGRTAGVITDWARTLTTDNATAAAVLYDEFGSDKHNARWLMLSFSETDWEVQHNAVHGLLSNALQWLEHRPVVYKASWPFPYHAAQIIEMDTEAGFLNASRFAAMMDKVNAPSTFFVLTSVALRFPETVKKLASGHEIAFHGDVHDGFKGQSEAVQAGRIDTMKADMKSILGNLDGINGFRAPLESYDKITEELLLKKGLRYHAADPNRSNAREPLFYPYARQDTDQALVVLPRTQLDDINLLKAGKNDKGLIRDALVNDYEQVKLMGALGLLSIHSQNFAENSPLAAAMPDFLDHLSKSRDTVWIAQSGQVAHWWHERERLTYKVKNTMAKMDIDVTINGKTPLQAVTLIVTNPSAKAAVNVRPLKTNTALPEIKPIDDFRTAIIFSAMQPGSYSYSLIFTNDSSV
ncbi:MAG: polysaccharide deacetylase family protein [Burkholderiaceae bacterium]